MFHSVFIVSDVAIFLKLQGGGTDKRDSQQQHLLSILCYRSCIRHPVLVHHCVKNLYPDIFSHHWTSLVPAKKLKHNRWVKNSPFEVGHEESVKIGNEINLCTICMWFSSVHFSPLNEVIDTNLWRGRERQFLNNHRIYFTNFLSLTLPSIQRHQKIKLKLIHKTPFVSNWEAAVRWWHN